MKKQLITSIIVLIFSKLSLGSCATLPDCSDAYPGSYVQDLDNCHNYYICTAGVEDPTLKSCSDEGCFVDPPGKCIDANSDYCSSCTGTDTTTVSTATTTTPTTIDKTTFTKPTTKITSTIVTTPNTVTTPTTSSTLTTISTPTISSTSSISSTPNTASMPTIASTSTTASTPNTVITPTISSTSASTISIATETITNKPVMCGNNVQGTMKPDPTNCRKFLICTSTGQWLLLPCTRDSCFFEALNTCYENVHFCTAFCGDDPVNSTTTTFTKQSTTTPTEKSTTISTKWTTSLPDKPDDCFDVNNFVCPKKGYFAKCNYCTQKYFSCSGYGATPMEGKCAGSLMFNPDPTYPYCLQPNNCLLSPIKPRTTTSQPISGCTSISEFNCPGQGYFAKCNYCVPDYFHCNHLGDTPTQGKCSGSLMFNLDPKYPFCLQTTNCPYSD